MAIDAKIHTLHSLQNLLDIRNFIHRRGLSSDFTSQLIDAINAVGRSEQLDSGLTLEDALVKITLEPQSLFEKLLRANATRVGFSPKRWGKIGRQVRKALKLSGAYPVVGARHLALTPQWLRLVQDLPKRHRVRLLARWASLNNLRPEQICNNCIPQFEAWLASWNHRRHYRRLLTTAIDG